MWNVRCEKGRQTKGGERESKKNREKSLWGVPRKTLNSIDSFSPSLSPFFLLHPLFPFSSFLSFILGKKTESQQWWTTITITIVSPFLSLSLPALSLFIISFSFSLLLSLYLLLFHFPSFFLFLCFFLFLSLAFRSYPIQCLQFQTKKSPKEKLINVTKWK